LLAVGEVVVVLVAGALWLGAHSPRSATEDESDVGSSWMGVMDGRTSARDPPPAPPAALGALARELVLRLTEIPLVPGPPPALILLPVAPNDGRVRRGEPDRPERKDEVTGIEPTGSMGRRSSGGRTKSCASGLGPGICECPRKRALGSGAAGTTAGTPIVTGFRMAERELRRLRGEMTLLLLSLELAE
jgi:hypothetical protein